MKEAYIRPGMTLRLKKARAEAYGMTERLVLVTALEPHPHYKTGFILSGSDAYRASDFEGHA